MHWPFNYGHEYATNVFSQVILLVDEIKEHVEDGIEKFIEGIEKVIDDDDQE